MSHLRSTSRKYLSQLSKTIQSRNQLRNMFQEKKLLDLGMYERAAELQKPIIESITKSSDTTNKELELIQGELTKLQSNGVQSQSQSQLQSTLPKINPIEKQSYDNKYVLSQRNGEFIKFNDEKYPIFRIGESSMKYVLYKHEGKEYIFNTDIKNYKEIEITPGLNELFFNGAGNINIISPTDIQTWEQLLKECGIPKQYKSSNFYHDVTGILKTPRAISTTKFKKETAQLSTPKIEEVSDSTNEEEEEEKPTTSKKKVKGKGMGVSTVIIPSDPNQLRHDLLLQLAASKSGNNKTFNHVNGLLKEMLKQKIIKSKDYRNILKEFYHI
jgi:hypothetical protein